MARNKVENYIIKMSQEQNKKTIKIIDSSILSFCKILSKIYGHDVDELYSYWKNGAGSLDNDFVLNIEETTPSSSSSSSSSSSNKKKDIIIEEEDDEKEILIQKEMEKQLVLKSKSKKKEVKADNEDGEETKESLSRKTVVQLKELCRERGIKVSGTKPELVARLLGEEVNKKSPEKKTTSRTKKVIEKPEKPVVEVVRKVITTENKIPNRICPRLNKFGNYEHPETRILIDKERGKAFGKQTDDGNVIPLTKDDLEICHKFKIPYDMPENLSTVKEDDDEEDEEEVLNEDDYKEEEEEEEVLEEEIE